MKTVMHILYTKLIKPLLFFLTEPEWIHDFMVRFGHAVGNYTFGRFLTRALFGFEDPALVQDVKGIRFENPIGLSAGFDKNAELINILPSLGFGYGQMGTITKKAYPGNEKPRLYRLKKSKSIVVNYGLKNEGVQKILERIRTSRHDKTVLGLSVGRTNSKETANAQLGIQDIYTCLANIIESDLGDLYTINISCPNLFGGESFTTKESLDTLLKTLYELPIEKPVFIKMPINLPWEDFDALLQVASRYNVDGVIIGNLNKDRHDQHIFDKIPEGIKGSLSGLPTQKLSNELIFNTYKHYKDTFVIVGVGGVFNARDAYEKIKNGASLVQLITGLIFEGPQVVGQINKGLVKLLRADGYSHIREAIGAYHR